MFLNFITKIDAKDFDYDYDSFGQNTKPISNFSLSWGANISANGQQISEISAYVPDQDLHLRIEKEIPVGKDGFDFVEEDFILKMTNVKVEYDRSQDSASRSLGLMPIKICNHGNEWVVTFTSGSL